MTTYIIAGVLLIVVLLAADAWRVRIINRRALEPLARGVTAMRRTATQQITYRPPTASEALAGDAVELYEAAARELVEHGLTVLGDLAEVQPDGAVAGMARWFVDASRTVTGWFGVTRGGDSGPTPVMLFFSESESGKFFVTQRGAVSLSLARPPANRYTYHPWSEPLARVLESHLAMPAALRRIEHIDEATALLTRLRDSTAAWRASQPADALLEADVRSVTQDRFEELGRSLIEYMSVRGNRT